MQANAHVALHPGVLSTDDKTLDEAAAIRDVCRQTLTCRVEFIYLISKQSRHQKF